MKNTARAAQKLGVGVVNGFTGSSIWHLLYSFPPVPQTMIDDGFELFAERWNPILDVFGECGVRFALEVHPTEIAFDIYTGRAGARGARQPRGVRLQLRPEPSALAGRRSGRVHPRVPRPHLSRPHQGRDRHAQRPSGILASHLNFGDPRRGWDFRSPGRGGVNFEEIIRALNQVGYEGPLSVEWEDIGMDREHGAREACEFVKKLDFAPSNVPSTRRSRNKRRARHGESIARRGLCEIA